MTVTTVRSGSNLVPKKLSLKSGTVKLDLQKKFGFCPNQRVRSFANPSCCFALELSSVHKCVESPTA